MNMNPKLHYTMYFYTLTGAVRDTMEYCISDRDKYNVLAYKGKKDIIFKSLDENSPFSRFCTTNGEVGQKVKEQMKGLYDLVYGDDSKAVRINDDNLIVDHSFDSKILDFVCPLHLSCKNITLAHYVNLAENEKDSKCEELIKLESKFFVLISQFVLSKTIFVTKFKAFNESMINNQGQKNVESNFIISEMTKLSSIHNWIRDNEGKDDPDFINTEEYMMKGFKLTSGEIQPREGKTIEQEVEELCKTINDILGKIEVDYNKAHKEVWEELTKYEQNLNLNSKN